MSKMIISLVVFQCFVGIKSVASSGPCYTSGKICMINSDTIDCQIKPDFGLGKIELGVSRLKDVERQFGQGIKNREWISENESPLIIGKICRSIEYKNKGIIFRATNNGKRLKLKRIDEIVILSNCKCQTKEGIGIGSSIEKIEHTFGMVDRILYSEEEGRIPFYLKGGVILTFYSKGAKSKEQFVTDRIELYRRKAKR